MATWLAVLLRRARWPEVALEAQATGRWWLMLTHSPEKAKTKPQTPRQGSRNVFTFTEFHTLPSPLIAGFFARP